MWNNLGIFLALFLFVHGDGSKITLEYVHISQVWPADLREG
jgi:hypothetical protein